ncbi:hypothetical protein K470DRAFT_256873 [Piedraia hortae CBS 480.64]|uniref:DNA polymerase n=1 Tax=Piedraia hortae CBS 480.64 TaxID=1314780 RepID=A0A6A7C2J4_9PEZI|nr:hypothetical protein K470DRAFT_256873 [Piedraia hortae CBS 480.64]
MGERQQEPFRVRLNCVDHCQCAPTVLDPPLWGVQATAQQAKLPQVPIIRVFGSTETGQKVCVHIHGAFPYLYVPYLESLEPDVVERYISTFRASIDHALALSYRRNPHSSNPRESTYVAHISLVKGVPFFGYNVGYRSFLKIYLLNPLHMTRFADLLQQGVVMKQIFQPYEAHMQYILQWMCDYNLYGCDYIETNTPSFRAPIPDWAEIHMTHRWHNGSISQNCILDADRFPRMSHCQLELDIRVEDILNRHAVQPRELHQSFVERLSSQKNLPPEKKLVHSMAGLWKDETRRRKRRMGLSDSASSPFAPEVLVSMSANPRSEHYGDWIHEAEFREMVDQLAQQECAARGDTDITFGAFERQLNPHDGIPTMLESVEDFYYKHISGNWNVNSGTDGTASQPQSAGNTQEIPGVALVDVSNISELYEDAECESDEDTARAKALSQMRDTEVEKVVEQDAELQQAHPDQPSVSPDLPARVRSKSELHRSSLFRVRDIVQPKAPHRIKDSDSKMQLPDGLRRGDSPPPSTQIAPLLQQATRNMSQLPSVVDPIYGERSQYSPRVDMQKDANSFNQPSVDGIPDGQSSNSYTSLFSKSANSSFIRRKQPLMSHMKLEQFAKTYGRSAHNLYLFTIAPPTRSEVRDSIDPQVIYEDAYYSNEMDVPERPREYGGQEFRLASNTVPYLQPFDKFGGVRLGRVTVDRFKVELEEQQRSRQCSLRSWKLAKHPPTALEVQGWVDAERRPKKRQQSNIRTPKRRDVSQIEGPTQKGSFGCKYTQRKTSTSIQHVTGYMSTMSLEVHVNTRGEFAPDPEKDEISMVVWYLSDEQIVQDQAFGGIVLLDGEGTLTKKVQKAVGTSIDVHAEDEELELINWIVHIVRSYDPDVLTGYEVHNSSWGYLIERARIQYEYKLPDELSRMKSKSHGRFGKDADRWGFTHTSAVTITGRHTINIWRALQGELALLQYTLENVTFQLLHRRIPRYSFATLTTWWQGSSPRDLFKVIDYFVSRTKLDLELLEANEFIARTSEQARLLGVDFFSVTSRGSQFKVESLMFRIAKPESFALVSPSRKQVGGQNALECLPLIMEPQSAFYTSPVLVLDFQSLYPSIMIAYNYCYSTCLGRVVPWRGTNKLGFTNFERAPGLLELVKDSLNIAPNGIMFVKPSVRKSLLAKMLGEILETRVMVKSGMKVDRDDKVLQRLLNNRQLALKLIANVTYGYTSASFSGRMPCSEIADSIVQTGRETLEKAIALIHATERWGAEVVYGDTDSLFVHLNGRTREEAFRIGEEMAKTITETNPRPMKLKIEKVYHPCILLTKKRYVGFKYESLDQKEPVFDAKGIETVRRDGTPAEQKIEEAALKILFRTSDLSQVKHYFQSQCTKIKSGSIGVQDFCFAKSVKLGTYADKGPPPPGALIATRKMLRDPRAEPQYGERVPYVVIAGAPGSRLWERCVEPERLVYDEHAELDAEYYITKNLIPPLERIFNLVGANVRQWYEEMPKVQRIRAVGGKKTMEAYMGSSHCVACRRRVEGALPLCSDCEAKKQDTMYALLMKLVKMERRVRETHMVCRNCAGFAPGEPVKCESKDCAIFYSRIKADTKLRVAKEGDVSRMLSRLELEW